MECWALGLCLVLLAAPGVAAGNKVALDLSGSSWELTELEQSLRLKVAGTGKSKSDQVLPETVELTLDPSGSWALSLGEESWFSGAEWVHKSPTKRRVRLRMTGDDLAEFAEQLVDEHIAAVANDGEDAEILSSKARGALRIVHASDGSSTGRLALRVTLKGRLTSPSGARRFQLKLRLRGETRPEATVSISEPPEPPYLPIVANFAFSPVGSEAPLTVNFASLATGTITDYRWSFGQGLESTLPNPTTQYLWAGEYLVTLTVSGPEGTHEHTKLVTVQPGPQQATKKLYLHYANDNPSWFEQLSLEDSPMVTVGGMPPYMGFTSGLEAVFRRVLQGPTNAATGYGVTLNLEVNEPITLRLTLVLVDTQGQERTLVEPIEQAFAASPDIQGFYLGSVGSTLMDGQAGDTLEFRLANVSPPSADPFPFYLYTPGSFVTVPDF